MGYSTWSDDFYRDRAATRKRDGVDTFAYHTATASKPRDQRVVHASLDPKGVKVRESRDSREHPNSLPIGVMLDVTGSMASTPREVQAALPKLMGLVTKLTGITDQQILFGAIGDATCDQGSLQIGQFESGIEMENHLTNFWLEGGGGGSNQESYQNAMYFFARHTSTDCWEKRQKKGFLFLMGDEHPYDQVRRTEVQRLFDCALQEDIPTTDLVKELQERYHVFFLIPRRASNGSDPRLRAKWTGLLGDDHVLLVEDATVVSETIALAIGIVEKTADFSQAFSALVEAGLSESAAHQVVEPLVPLAKACGVDLTVPMPRNLSL